MLVRRFIGLPVAGAVRIPAVFTKNCLPRLKVTPPVTQNQPGRSSAIADEIGVTEVYALSRRKRKRIKRRLSVDKSGGPIGQVEARGIKNGDQLFVMTPAAYSLLRERTLPQRRPLTA